MKIYRDTITKIIGWRPTQTKETAEIGMAGINHEFILSFETDKLLELALNALKASAALDNQSSQFGSPGILRGFVCERWEFSSLPDMSVLLSFRVKGGAWVRIQIPKIAVTGMRETLEAIEGRFTEGSAIFQKVN